MMRSFYFLFCLLLSVSLAANAQDYSNRGLMQIKELADNARLNWNKAFDEAAQTKNMVALPAQRQQLERFLDGNLANMKQLMAQGDERALLIAIANYLQIEKQYLKNVMIPAETIKPTDADAIGRVNQQNIDFGQKEKFFLMEINNALATSGNDDIPAPTQQQVKGKEENDEDEGVENAKNKSAILGDEPKAKKHQKLPHEIMDEEDAPPPPAKKTKGKHKGKQTAEEEEE